jgi:hypothetical protein
MERAQEAIMEGERSRSVEWRRVRRAVSWVGVRLLVKMWEKARDISVGGILGWSWEERRLRRGVIEMGVGGGESGVGGGVAIVVALGESM